ASRGSGTRLTCPARGDRRAPPRTREAMMATHHHKVGGTTALPLALIGQAIPMLSRHDLEALTERLIDRLDQVDGDPDVEEDDPSGQSDEDGVNPGRAVFVMHGASYAGPGCPISDNDRSY